MVPVRKEEKVINQNDKVVGTSTETKIGTLIRLVDRNRASMRPLFPIQMAVNVYIFLALDLSPKSHASNR